MTKEITRLEKDAQAYRVETVKSSDTEKIRLLDEKGKELLANPDISEEQKN